MRIWFKGYGKKCYITSDAKCVLFLLWNYSFKDNSIRYTIYGNNKKPILDFFIEEDGRRIEVRK